MTLRLMAVHAHPDDESSKGAATLLRYVSEGVDVMVITCTDGGSGEILNPDLKKGIFQARNQIDMIAARRNEMERAAKILGVRHEWLGFKDSGYTLNNGANAVDGSFSTLPVEVAAGELVAKIRSFKPHVLITYDEIGGYPHLDHIMSHRISVHAFDAAGDAEQYPELGPPWQPQKLYYSRTRSTERCIALQDAMIKKGVFVAPWVEGATRPDGWEPSTRIKCDEFFSLRDEALRQHATQVTRDDQLWFCVPNEVERRVWPTEDYELRSSHVPTSIPEHDLFAGLRESC